MSFIPKHYAMDDAQKQGGRLQAVESQLYYSPNSTRTLSHIPPPHVTHDRPMKNPFLPTPDERGRYAFESIKVSDYHSPLWWSSQFEWAAFIPRHSVFKGPIFGTIKHSPDLQELYHHETHGFGMQPLQMHEWNDLAEDLSLAIVTLAKHSGTSLLLPVLPSIFGYRNFFDTGQEALHNIERSREWFSLWIGALCYVVAAVNAKTKLQPDSNSWEEILVQRGCHRLWIEGTTINIVSIFFLDNNVPVWYKWNDALKHLSFGPTNDQQESFLKEPSSPPVQQPPWVEFFAKRALENQRTESLETLEQKQRRHSRMLQLPMSTANVFEWVQDESDTWKRKSVSKTVNRSTLELYGSSCVRYDPFRNEFDCCRMFDPGTESSRTIVRTMASFTGEDVRTYQCINNLPSTFSNPYGNSVKFDDSPSPHLTSLPNIDTLESHIRTICALHFGFTGPPPNAHPAQPFDISAQKNFLKLLGIQWTEKRAEIFKKGSMASMHDFLDSLAAKRFSSIRQDEWDLSREHRATMHLNIRLKTIRKLAAGTKIYYMFLLPDDGDWHITTTYAAHALMLCRLAHQYNSQDLAMYMLNQGMPFHTMQSAKSLPRAPPSSVTSALHTPRREKDHIFTVKDYQVFSERLKAYTAQSPRAARAALKRGGYTWRSCTHVLFSTVLDGPMVWSTDHDEYICAIDINTGIEYIDDKLTDKELELFCGMYICSTGRGSQIAKKSWFPLAFTFENSGLDYGFWTENSENIFKIVSDNVAKRQPISLSLWASRLKGSKQLKILLASSNEAAAKLITGW
ncbi:hypothetical protein CPC08DRAFT_816433 [Agrocybe pediades]|nr:hypothetical protein CPC08DRAFT_816433 [Agrocybe pediades]